VSRSSKVEPTVSSHGVSADSSILDRARALVEITLGVCHDNLGNHFACRADDLSSDFPTRSVGLYHSTNSHERIGQAVTYFKHCGFTWRQHYSIASRLR